MQSPRHIRVYLEQAATIAINELTFMGGLLSQPITSIRESCIGGVSYILFDCGGDEPLGLEDIRLLSRLSFAYALFEVRAGLENETPGETLNCLLAPVGKDCGYFIDEDISAILKYSGKTNELFTRLMLNLALTYCKNANSSAADHRVSESVNLLDPMAGKGTTLYEGLMQDCNVYGVEIDPKPAYEAFVYIKKHFEMARYKHTSHTEKTGGIDSSGKKFSATRYQVEMARSKEEQKAGQARRFEIIAGDTRHTGAFFKKNFFDVIVADLPYGVQHGAKKKPQEAGLTRNALGLVKEAIPGWIKVLKPGGVVVLAWNLFLIPREEMEQVFADNRLVVPEGLAGLDFSHRLDQATHRDLILGVYRGSV